MTKNIGIAVIGCGDISRARYFPAIHTSPDFELRGLYSRTAKTCEPLAAKYGGKIYPDLAALLRVPEIEAVVIATPHPSHADIAVSSLKAGKHVLCEKPIATSLADASRIIESAQRSERVFMALPFDGSPPIEAAKRLLGDSAIGRVSSANAMLAHRGPKHAPWFLDREKAGWGVSADLGIYLISQLTYFFGSARRVRGRVETLFPERKSEAGETIEVSVDDNAAAIVEWPDATLATIRANWCSASDHRNVICETRIYGTQGIIFINPFAKTHQIVVYSPERAIKGAKRIEYNGMSDCYEPALEPWDGDSVILHYFAEQIGSGGADARANALRQRHVIEIIDKLYAASNSGKALELETT
jgi:predicted dehydrogenase